MACSIGNQLYDVVDRKTRIYYILTDLFDRLDHEAASDEVLYEKADYVFDVVKAHHGFTSENIMVKNHVRTMSKIDYNFAPREPVDNEKN